MWLRHVYVEILTFRREERRKKEGKKERKKEKEEMRHEQNKTGGCLWQKDQVEKNESANRKRTKLTDE